MATEVWPRVELVTPQAANSKTFTPPPATGMVYTVGLDWNHDNNPDHPHFVYAHPQTNEPVYVTWRETVEAAWRITHRINKFLDGYTGPKPKFAILAVLDTTTYTTLINGILRAGYEAFLASPRMSAPIIAQMLEAEGTTHVFVTPDPGMQALIAGVQQIMGEGKIVAVPVPLYTDVFIDEPVERPAPYVPSLDDVSIVIHSSGSTSTPKRVPYRYRAIAQMTAYSGHSQVDTCITIGWHVMPMFHLMGAGAMSCSSWSGATVAVYPPVFPPVTPSPDTALSHLVYTKCDAVILPPVIIHALMAYKAKETVEIFKKMLTVAYGGGSLNKAVGDRLAAAGVTLGNLYGMTEVLSISKFLPLPIPGEDWEWTQVHRGINIHFRPLDETNTTFEPIYMESEWAKNNINNTVIDGVPGYSSNDVVLKHPTIPGAIKVIGRIDDQIMLSTGEKTNPIPLEGILVTDPHIQSVITFGRGRPYGGILIQPKPAFVFDGRDAAKLKEFREMIAPTIQKMNDFAPTHSRVFPEMILVTSPDRPFVLTQKGTPQRSDALQKYEADINAAYEAAELSSDSIFPTPDTWTLESASTFVRDIVHNVISSKPSDTDDVFQHGCDSLRAAWIRNAIANSLPEEQGSQLVRDAVYQAPTIARLTTTLLRVVAPDVVADVDDSQAKAAELEEMVAKYTAEFPAHTGTLPAPGKKTVLVTGTTGGLGSHLLHSLLADPTVERVYAVNRAGGDKSLEQRHEEAYKSRGLDLDGLSGALSSGRVKIVVANTAAEKLGLSDEAYTELANSVTHILHNAWPVNFNYQIATFEPAVKSVRGLVDLALASPYAAPPRLLFVSSVSVVRAVKSEGPTPEEYVENPAEVAGLGYGESKWVAETILRRASEATPIVPVSVRVGQISGGANGNWNASDWVPSIIRSGKPLGLLPDLGDAAVSWIRLDETAQTLIEMVYSSTTGILHLVHPQTVTWTDLFTSVSKVLATPLVPYADWLASLEGQQNSVEAARDIPALRLLSFFRAIAAGRAGDEEGFTGLESLSTAKALVASPTLAAMAPLNEKDVKLWVGFWRATGSLA